MGKVRIFTDTGCDLEPSVMQEYGIECFSMPVTVNGMTYRDRQDIWPEEFYRLLEDKDAIPSTAQISPADFRTAFQPILNETDDEIIYIAFSSGCSGTYQSAVLTAQDLDPQRITVIDSLSASIGHGLIVLRAAQMAAEGHSRDEIVTVAEDYVRRMQHIFIVGNFEMLRRGGRVGNAAAMLGDLLNIKLILHFVDGKIVPLEKIRGLKKAKKRMLEVMEERAADDVKDQLIGLSHAHDLNGAQEMQQLVQERLGCEKFFVSEIGATIGSHVGAGTCALFFLSK